MRNTLNNKVIIITGASSGIGRALAFECAKKGANLSLAARNYDKLKQLENELSKYNVDVLSVKTDVSIEDNCKNLINETIKKYNKIDVLINNAGISMRALFKDVKLDVIKKLIDVNFWGTVYCTKYALPYLLDTKGSVIGITSIAGYHGLPGRIGYSASKFAMTGFLETLRIENLKTGLHVMMVAPWFTASNIRKSALLANGTSQGETPRKEEKMMTSEKAAFHIVKGIIKRKRNIILSLKGKISVLIQRIVPKYLDHIFYNQMSKEPDSPFK
ncbi:MAG: SDR family oxidoreductase [Bacteroidales bacterium]|nr:SDR family oxidoreductase [Bacteroidales bacterium]